MTPWKVDFLSFLCFLSCKTHTKLKSALLRVVSLYSLAYKQAITSFSNLSFDWYFRCSYEVSAERVKSLSCIALKIFNLSIIHVWVAPWVEKCGNFCIYKHWQYCSSISYDKFYSFAERQTNLYLSELPHNKTRSTLKRIFFLFS